MMKAIFGISRPESSEANFTTLNRRRSGPLRTWTLMGVWFASLFGSVQAQADPLSEPAQRALTHAESAVENARAHDALWTTALQSMKEAREAAKAGDNGAVIKKSERASELAKLGIDQTRYPLVH